MFNKPIISRFRTATIDGALRIVYAGTTIPGDGRHYTRAEALAIFLDMRRVDLIGRARRDFRIANNCDAGDSMMTDPEANR